MALCFFEAAGERAGQVDGVGIGEEQPFAAGSAGSGDDGVVLAGPAWGERAGFDQSHLPV